MNYPNLLRKLRLPAAALLLVLSHSTTCWAQGGDPDEEAEHRAKLLEYQQRAEAMAMARAAGGANVIDRAMANMAVGKLQVETYNWGTLTGGEFGSSMNFPDIEGRRRNYTFWNETVLGFKEGPWHANAMVHENHDHDYARLDWEAKDGSWGDLFHDPPVMTSGFPTMAISDLEDTWPIIGGKPTWPAPEGVSEVWWGTETWNKWERAGDRNAYGEFNDKYADREGDGLSKSMGIEVKYRSIAYAANNVVFFQYEFTNTSSNNYTDVFVGNISDMGAPSTDDNDASPFWDEAHQLVWTRHWHYDATKGTHTRDNYSPVSFLGTMWLESPTGSFRKDSGGNLQDTPDEIITRLALLRYNARIYREDHGEEALYGALSGDVSYMDASEAQYIWKTLLPGGPIMFQSNADYVATWDNDCDPLFYASSGPFDFPAGSSINFVVAAVAGFTEPGMFEQADKAIDTYNAYFQGPSPPQRPENFQANGVLGGPRGVEFNDVLHDYQTYYCPSGNITISWDISKALTIPDAASGVLDFEGIRIYRSMNRGDSWGLQSLGGDQVLGSWIPYVQWDLANGIKGLDGMSDKYLGDDTGLVTSWTDTDALDGIEYWYAITSYDQGEFSGGVQVLESLETAPGDDPNYPSCIAVIAGSRPNGYADGMVGIGTSAGSQLYIYNEDAEEEYEASIYIETVNENDITGDDYSISLTNYAIDVVGDTTYTSLLTTGSGNEWLATGITLTNTATSTVLFESLAPTISALGTGSLPVTEGFRVVANDPNDGQPGLHDFSVVDVPDSSGWSLYRSRPYSRSLERIITRDAYWDFEMIWRTVNPTTGDTNRAVSRGTPKEVVNAPFEIWRLDSSGAQTTRMWPIISDYEGSSNDWDSGWEYIYVTDIPYADDFFDAVKYPEHDPAAAYWSWDEDDPLNSRSDWLWEFGWNQSNPNTWYEDETWVGQVYKPLAIDFSLTRPFTNTAPTIADTLIDYDDIKVVPNPYLITAPWDQTVNRRMIQFTNVPPNSTVDIYTLAGELVASLDHGDFVDPVSGSRNYLSDKVGTVIWNIWTYEFTEAAYGLYIYVVSVGDSVKKVGKFAIIR